MEQASEERCVWEKERVVARLGLQPHPEGGYFKETFRSALTVDTPFGQRSASTGILFLLGRDDRSHLHRIKSEEMWHFYQGDTISVVELNEATQEFHVTRLGPNFDKGEVLQHVVPANVWFGAFIDGHHSGAAASAGFGLVGCTVAPGFDFQDFELATREPLTALFPAASEMIAKLSIS